LYNWEKIPKNLVKMEKNAVNEIFIASKVKKNKKHKKKKYNNTFSEDRIELDRAELLSMFGSTALSFIIFSVVKYLNYK